ncbi:hypothetical protein [Desulfovibrio sp. ZJ200]|uniref:hypothetical protein n=1 Tax=Desulfovibrio sp. ZJ200 TaxID=2709792 RepID=UPI0013EB2657|nr:hypothetical protein [Desulfovibrio sp. ZJ200]
MATITIPTFGGEVPRTTPRLLEATQAQRAVNCDLRRGALEALRLPAKRHELAATALSIFKHRQDGWLAWPNVVNVVKSAVIDAEGDKPLGHLFLTGARAYPTQYLAGGEEYRLGIPRPGAAPLVAVARGAVEKTVACYAWGADSDSQIPPRYGYEDTLAPIREDNVSVAAFAASASEEPESSPTDSGIGRSSAYCYTLVQSLADGIFQQESAPSPPSEVVDVLDGDGVTLSGFEIPEVDGLKVTHIRLYRTQSGEKTSEFHFLAELPVPVASYLDTTHDADLSTLVLQTTTWDCIPDDARGLIVADNGIYAAFRGNELLISEPNYAYVFPADYRLVVEDQIVALGHTDNTIVVLTTGRPYLATGSDPGQMQLTHLPIEQSCVSARSVGSLPGGVVYASPDGLMLFTASDQSLVSGQTFTRDQWQELGPQNLMGTVLDGKYIGFFAGTRHGLIYSVGAKDIVRVELPKGWQVRALYHHSVDDCIYLSIDTPEGSGVYQWEAGAPMRYTWRSKPFFFSALTAMSAVRIEGEQTGGDPVDVTIFGPDAEYPRSMLEIRSTRTARITATRAEKLWSLEIQGTATVYEARLGGSVEGVEYGA